MPTMAYLLSRLLLSAALVPVGFAAAQTTAPPGGVDVEHYRIAVEVHDDKLVQKVDLTVRVPKPVESWDLRLDGKTKVLSVASGGEAIPFRRRPGAVALDLRGLGTPKGPVTIAIETEGAPYNKQSNGYVRTCVTPEITHIRSQYAWYPRAPRDAATYTIVVHAKEAWQVRTAGDVSRGEPVGGRGVWTFEQRSPVLDVGLVAGPYETVVVETRGDFTLDAMVFPRHRKSARALLEVARRAYEFYAARFGAVEASRFTVVEMPATFGAGSGYGEAGYVLIGEGAFAAGAETGWALSLVAHEVSHTWWGQQVAFSDFSNESLACYATHEFLEADRGEDAARRERRAAVQRVVDAAASGKEVALTGIEGWGGGMDSTTYRVHAYEKGMMLLTMTERAVGAASMNRALSRLFREQRGKIIGYATLREELIRAGKKARAVVEHWEKPGIPRLEIEHKIVRSGKRFKVTGTLSQQGTTRPFPMQVRVVARSGGEQVATTVKLTGRKKKFTMTVPSQPEAVVVDPDYEVLAIRPSVGPSDPKKVIEVAFKVVNSPGQDDPTVLRKTIAALTDLLGGDPGKYEGLCYTGMGRCHFRLGEFDPARGAFAKALPLGAGGPFHRAWIHLRLGNMADVDKKRSKARSHYQRAVEQGTNYLAAKRAAGYLDKPYRGYAKDK